MAFADELEGELERLDTRQSRANELYAEQLTQLDLQIYNMTQKALAVTLPELIEACEHEIRTLKSQKIGLLEKMNTPPIAIKKEMLLVGLRLFAEPKKVRNEASDQEKSKVARLRFKEPLIIIKDQKTILNR